jgi:crotonobetainyl-CoA hydratase
LTAYQHVLYEKKGDRERMKVLLASQDFREGPRAFAEKRKPNWTGK